MWFLAQVHRPYYVIFYVTSRCNAACPFCLNRERWKAASEPDELSLDEIRRIAGRAPSLRILSLTGGEPFLRADLSDILDIFVSESNVQYVTLHTNGFSPEGLRRALERAAARPELKLIYVCLSLDELGSAHDRIRGVPGLFEKNLECIEIVKAMRRRDRRVDVLVGTVLHEGNRSRIQAIREFVVGELGVKHDFSMARPAAAADGSGTAGVDATLPAVACPEVYPRFSVPAVRRAIDLVVPEVVQQQLNSGRRVTPCIAGRNLLVLYEDGSLRACECRSSDLGNVRDHEYDLVRTATQRGNRPLLASIRRRECTCDWFNPMPFNLVYSPRHYGRILRKWLLPGRHEGPSL